MVCQVTILRCKAILCRGQLGQMRQMFLMNHTPGAGFTARNVLTSSPARYHCATYAPPVVWMCYYVSMINCMIRFVTTTKPECHQLWRNATCPSSNLQTKIADSASILYSQKHKLPAQSLQFLSAFSMWFQDIHTDIKAKRISKHWHFRTSGSPKPTTVCKKNE